MIRWKRIKQIASEIANRNIEVHASTALKKLIAFLGTDNEVLVNINICKEEDEVVVAVSHEVSHIIIGNNEHDEKFNDIFNNILDLFSNRMKLSNLDSVAKYLNHL